MAPSLEIVEVYFEKFATTTVIRVFNFIRTSAFIVERIFWIAILLGFSFMTVLSVTRTIQTFRSEPTASHVIYVSNASAGLKFPRAIACLNVRSDKLLSLYEHKVDDVVELISAKNDFGEALKNKLGKIYKVENERATQLTAKKVEDYHQFVASNQKIFTENELALLGISIAMYVRLIYVEADLTLSFLRWQSEPVRRVYEAYMEKGLNFSELFGLLSSMFCAVLQVRFLAVRLNVFTGSSEYAPWNICERFSRPFYFGFDDSRRETFCLRLGDDAGGDVPFFFGSTYDSVFISMHPEALYANFVKVPEVVGFDIGGKFPFQEHPIQPRLAFVGKHTVEFTLDTVSRSVNLRRRGCFESETSIRFQCVGWCRSQLIIAGCGCMPMLGDIVAQFAPFPVRPSKGCATSELARSGTVSSEKCRRSLSSDYIFDETNCSHACYDRDCESWNFNYKIIENDPSLAAINATTVVRLVPASFVYQKVDEYITMDFMGCVTALGGNLSLYLGASFLAIIHIVVFFIKLPFELFHRAKGETAGDIGTVLNTQLLENLLETNKGLVSDVASMRRQLRAVERRIELIDLDRRLLRGTLLLHGMQPP